MDQKNQSNLGFEPAEIEHQMEHILGNPKFLIADQLSRFLRFVVEETLAGRQDQIKQYTIGVKALGRDASFKPNTDPLVRTQAHRLRRALRRYYDSEGANDPIKIEIPKGRYIPVFLPNQKKIQFPELSVDRITSGAVVVDVHERPSIAVMPLVYLGNKQDDAYFATGLTEEIVIDLTNYSEFLVVGPLNRDKIWKQHLGPRGIGQQYNVRFVLDGTVRKQENTLRVTVKLTDAVSGKNLWGQIYHYDLGLTSIIEADKDIVSQVVATIADSFGIIPRVLTKESLDRNIANLSDYEAILRFYHHSTVVTEASYVAAITALEQAVDRDANNVMAAALLGDLLATTYHIGIDDSESLLDRAESLGRKALALDLNCQPAHYTMALVYFLRLQRGLCVEEINKTLLLNPNSANYLAASALLLGPLGEWNRALELLNKATRLNPHHPGWYHFVPFMNFYRQGLFDSAYNEALDFNTPTFYIDPLIRTAVLGQIGRELESEKAKDELLALVPDFNRRGQSLIRRAVYSEEHTIQIIAGLQKAGIEMIIEG